VLRTRAPRTLLPFRLACIRPAASVHPEPGSNSPSYVALVPPIAGRACILNVCRSVDLIVCCPTISKNFRPGQSPGQRGIQISARKPGRKGNSLFRSRKRLFVFFLESLSGAFKTNTPISFLSSPRRPLRGCKGTNIQLICNTSKEKNMGKFETKRQDAGIQ
jgi:hypothetical protein